MGFIRQVIILLVFFRQFLGPDRGYNVFCGCAAFGAGRIHPLFSLADHLQSDLLCGRDQGRMTGLLLPAFFFFQ